MRASELGAVRLFVSVELPELIKSKLASLSDEFPSDSITPVRPENMHLTLKFIGEVPLAAIANIEQKLQLIEFDSFSLSLKSVGVFPNENYVRVVWVGCESEELVSLAKKINKALADIGKKDDREFSAHLTIARVKQKIDVRDFLNAHANEEFGSFEVRSFQLMRSELAFGKPPKYSIVKSFESISKQNTKP